MSIHAMSHAADQRILVGLLSQIGEQTPKSRFQARWLKRRHRSHPYILARPPALDPTYRCVTYHPRERSG